MNYNINKSIEISGIITLKDLLEFLKSLNSNTNLSEMLDFKIIFISSDENKKEDYQSFLNSLPFKDDTVRTLLSDRATEFENNPVPIENEINVLDGNLSFDFE